MYGGVMTGQSKKEMYLAGVRRALSDNSRRNWSTGANHTPKPRTTKPAASGGVSGKRNEKSEHKDVIRWIYANGLEPLHPANGQVLAGTKTQRVRQWSELVAMGARKGFPDILILNKNKNGRMTALEMKRADGRPSDLSAEQKGWQVLLPELGIDALVGFGAEDAIEKLKGVGYGG